MSKATCSADECERPARARGWCMTHYYRWYRSDEAVILRLRGRTWIERGYLIRWDPSHPVAMANGNCPVHRAIAWDAGILTDLSHDVHHINGDRLDNSIENLAALPHGEHAAHHRRAEAANR